MQKADTGMQEVDPDRIEQDGAAAIRGLLARQPAWAKGAISSADALFLSGLLRHLAPRKIVEIGVASGWSGAVMLEALRGQPELEIHGVDLSPTFYLDSAVPTGRVISEVLPDQARRYRLHTGKLSLGAMDAVGAVDFGFIDAHHMHPWATLDMIALLPFLKKGSWVAMHDINLCRIPRHRHKNRGPFYLFHSWPGRRVRSTPEMPMIGAVELALEPNAYLGFLIELLYTPWEVPIDAAAAALAADFAERHFDPASSAGLKEAITTMCAAPRPS